jgi:hypothetical protein
MSLFEDINSTTDKASDIGERFLKTSRQYYRLKLFQQLTISLSMVVKLLAIGGFLFVGILFFSIALAIKLGNELDSFVLGMVLVGLIYLVVAVILYLLKSRINAFIIKKVGSKFFD